MLTSIQYVGFQDSMYACRYYGTDCRAIMMIASEAAFGNRDPRCVVLTERGSQRYSTGDNVALAIKGHLGTGLSG